ncbi:hypothetical protein V8E53_003059 [Lactarius tabidus]
MFAKVLASKNVRAIPAVLDCDRHSLASRPPNHPRPPTFCDAIIVCDPEGPEHLDLCSTRATVDRLRGQELVRAYSSNHLAVTAAVFRKECERASGVTKAAITRK